MTGEVNRLVSNLLDALDRLYDQKTTVADLHALLEASAVALRETDLAAELTRATDAVGRIGSEVHRSEQERNRYALRVTDELRQQLASWDFGEPERH